MTLKAITVPTLLQLIIWVYQCYAEVTITRENMPGAQYYDGKKLNIPVSTEAGREIYERWAFQSMSGLISSIANKRAENMNEYYKNRLFKCSKSSETIFDQSECVFRVVDEYEKRKKQRKNRGGRLEYLNSFVESREPYVPPKELYHPTKEIVEKAVQYRTKREVIRQQNYKLHSEMENITPVGIIGKYLSRMVSRLKNKNTQRPYESVIGELKKKQEKIQKAKKIREEMKKRFAFAKHGASHMLKTAKLTAAEKKMAEELQMPDDIIDAMKQRHGNLDSKQVSETMGILRGAIKLAAKMARDNETAELADKQMRIASPRFLSVVPEDEEKQLSLLSPSLFSLHNEGRGLEQSLSLPNIANSFNSSDYKEWLQFIVEASGVSDSVDEMKKDETEGDGIMAVDYASAPRGIDGQPMYLTKENLTEIGGPREYQKAEVMEKLQKMLEKDQMEQFSSDGYSVLTPEQLDLIYGKDSPYANKHALRAFKNMTKTQALTIMEANLRSLGKAQSSDQRRRKRSIILSPVAFAAIISDPAETSQPFILSPVIFTLALFSPAVLGPVILTPWLFVGIIISPRVLCPVIVSPVALSAIVLSPLVFAPLILSPAALVAFVLSPIVLSPNILTPNVLVPAILSPLVLSPNILTPNAVNAIVLSPFVLNPAVFSPSYISTLVLSPHALSPLINSTGKGVSLVLSPSALS